MDVHFFMDPLGYYANKFAERAFEIKPDLVIININQSKINHPKILYIENYKELKKWIKNNKISKVSFHFYNSIFQDINLKIKKKNINCLSYWFFWSGEFYELPEIKDNYLLNFSLNYYQKKSKKNTKIKKSLKPFYKALINKNVYIHKSFIKSFKHINFFVSTFEKDFEFINSYSKSKMSQLYFSYLSIEQTLGDLIYVNPEIKENHILVGHSASPILNHYEIILSLQNIKLVSPTKITIPLSYGDMDYKKLLLENIKEIELEISILNDFMGIDQYNLFLNTVSHAIINSQIQIGFGNTISMLWLGIKLFLSESSAVYYELKKWGIIVYKIQDINEKEINTPLSLEDQIHNREILKSQLSENKVKELYNQILNN